MSACTWYVAPNGSVRSGGRSLQGPTTLRFAALHTAPGDVVCLGHGVYRLTRTLILRSGGSSDAWVVFRSYNGRVLITPRSSMDAALIQIRAPAAYLEFRGLSFDGGTTRAWEAYQVERRSHHVRVIENTITNMSSAGIATTGADYVMYVGNRISRFGDGVGWSSGISINSSSGTFWYDGDSGFHNIIAGNIITGGVDNSSYHTDGNGIIADQGGSVPPVLIANNLVYLNGGRCIHALDVQHVWMVNNTCYMNGLDSRLGVTGEIIAHNAQDVHVINNVAVAWTNRRPYAVEAGSSVSFSHNVAYGGIASLVPQDVVGDSSALTLMDPQFADPIRVDPSADGLWNNPPSPSTVGARFRPKATSGLRRLGADPRDEPGVTGALAPTLGAVLSRDLAGASRWSNGRYSIGAFDK